MKFQMRDVETFYPKHVLEKKYPSPFGNTFYDYRKRLELKKEHLELIKYYKKKLDIKIIFSTLDFISYKNLKKEGFNFFKIPSTISCDRKFIKFLAKEELKKIIVSTGMTDQKYINFIIKSFKKFNKVYLLHCISSYPASFYNINLNILDSFKKLSEKYKNFIPGYSSHDPGVLGSLLAVTKGAKMIEKHVKIGVTDWMHFDDTAIDAELELPKYVEYIQKTYSAMGSDKKLVYPFENHKYDFRK